MTKCDGKHGGAPCDDKECWRGDGVFAKGRRLRIILTEGIPQEIRGDFVVGSSNGITLEYAQWDIPGSGLISPRHVWIPYSAIRMIEWVM